MSITIKSGEAISRSPINNSISKQMYSFPKAPRFTFIDPNIPKEKRFWKIKENIGKTDNYYDIPEFLSKRFTTMGSGKRVDFTLSQKGVNTKYYSNPTDFDPLHPHGPRFSFPKAGAVKREKKKKKEVRKIMVKRRTMMKLNIPLSIIILNLLVGMHLSSL